MKTFLLWHGQECLAGETIDLPDSVALAYVRTDQAETIEHEKPIEAATIAPPLQNAMRNNQPQLKRR